MVLKVFRDFEQNYPERLGEAFVINSKLLVLFYVSIIYLFLLIRECMGMSFVQQLHGF